MLKKLIAACVIAGVLLRWRNICPWAKRNVARRVPRRPLTNPLDPSAPRPKLNRVGVVLMNLGTPTKPTPWFVRKFLVEFLSDYRVIDSLPAFVRIPLVYLIITPIRCFTSGRSYADLWRLHQGTSPLLEHSRDVAVMVQKFLGEDYVVASGMRYQEPSLAATMNTLCDSKCRSVIVLPMFPQYASSSSGSAMEWAMHFIGQWDVIPHMHFVSHFFSHPRYIDAMVRSLSSEAAGGDITSFDHVLFSFHGLPWRHVTRICEYCERVDPQTKPFPCKYRDKQANSAAHICMDRLDENNAYCYRAHCYATTRYIAERLGLTDEQYSVVFQSRFGSDPWLQPYAEDVIRSLPSRGKKHVAIVGPSFVTDCLETTCELGKEYKEVFLSEGGKEWYLFPALNASEHWARAVADIVLEKRALM